MCRIAPSLLAAVLLGSGAAQACTGVASADGMVCAVVRGAGVAPGDIQRLADQAAREREALIVYLGNDVGPITLVVRGKGIARHKPPATIFIPVRLIAKSTAITAHETTHLLTQGWASRVLKEGLAVYTQYRLGEQQGWPNYRRSVHAAARRWIGDDSVTVRTPDEAAAAFRRAGKGDTKLKLAAYSVSGSWVMWIVERKLGGGIRRFLDTLYRKGDYEAALGQHYPALVAEWRAYLQAH